MVWLGWPPYPPLLSHLAFLGTLGGGALFVLAAHLGFTRGLNLSVAAFGFFYGLWSAAFQVLFSSPGGAAPEFVYFGATLGMFGLPVAAVFITLSLGKLGRTSRFVTGAIVCLVAAAVIVWALVRHRFFPGLLALSLDNTPVSPFETWIPALVFAVNGAAFSVGFWGMVWARAAQPSRRLRHQVSLVMVQLAAGLAAFVAASVAELVFSWSPWGMVTLLYPLFLNFYLIWRYRYLRFDLPALGPEIIDSLQEAVFLLDAHLTILRSNPAASRVFSGLGGPFEGRKFAPLFDEPEVVVGLSAAARRTAERQTLGGVALGKGTATLVMTAHTDAFGDFVGFVALVDRSDAFDAAADRYGLTPREKEVSALLVQGLSVRQMADGLFVSEATIKTHLIRLYRKSGARNRVTFLQNILQNR